MKQLLSVLSDLTGSYYGQGVNHENLPFSGTLTFSNSFQDKGFSIDFTARGADGTVYHKEHSVLGLNGQGGVSLWVMSDNHPGVMEHRLNDGGLTVGALHTFSFVAGVLSESNQFRESVTLDIWPDGDISYRYAWGLPGGEFKERSGLRLKHGSRIPIPEAKLVQSASGLLPEGKGWYILNAKEAAWKKNSKFGECCTFEGNERFLQYGINIHVVYPDQPNCHYHGEDDQEDFLVLSGQCKLIIEGQERLLKPWDFVHCPKWTRHVFVGYGKDPCAILMVGGRTGDGVIYPVIPLSAKYGASPEVETPSPKESYAHCPAWCVAEQPFTRF